MSFSEVDLDFPDYQAQHSVTYLLDRIEEIGLSRRSQNLNINLSIRNGEASRDFTLGEILTSPIGNEFVALLARSDPRAPQVLGAVYASIMDPSWKAALNAARNAEHIIGYQDQSGNFRTLPPAPYRVDEEEGELDDLAERILEAGI